jgi:hypothetical protein
MSLLSSNIGGSKHTVFVLLNTKLRKAPPEKLNLRSGRLIVPCILKSESMLQYRNKVI